VICDRYIDSTRAYQGFAGGIDDAAILMLHDFGSSGLLPDRTFLLTLPAEVGAARAAARDGLAADRFARRDPRFHGAVTAAFDEFAVNDPKRFCRIDATLRAPEVTAAMLDALADLLP
jgi:dTMP kinase